MNPISEYAIPIANRKGSYAITKQDSRRSRFRLQRKDSIVGFALYRNTKVISVVISDVPCPGPTAETPRNLQPATCAHAAENLVY